MNLGVFGIGPMEILVLLLCTFGLVGGVVIVVLTVVASNRKKNRPLGRPYVDDLEHENDELRDEIERLKRRRDNQPPGVGRDQFEQ